MFLFAAGSAFAQDIPDFMQPDMNRFKKVTPRLKHTKVKPQLLKSSAIERRPYDVLIYNVYMDWYNALSSTATDSAGRSYWGRNKITLRIDQITINGVNLQPVPQPEKGILSIPVSEFNAGDMVALLIYYTNISKRNGGFYLYPKGMFVESFQQPPNDSVFIEERIAYTMSEPEDARMWMPCNDAPYDKAIASIAVRVPFGYSVCSNGLLKSIDTMSANSLVYSWTDTTQIPTYLMSANASKFKEFSHWYHKVTKPQDSIEIQYYVWEKDYKNQADSIYNYATDGDKFNAYHTFENVVKMTEIFSNKFIEYPFQKYGMVSVQKFGAGGMEHQTLTTINRSWLRDKNTWGGNSSWGNQMGIAHELAHMWLGDLITCATWHDIWINEGGATWGEAIYVEGLYGSDSYYNSWAGRKNTYLWYGGLALPSNYDVPINDAFNGGLSYAKAGWVYHMLRTTLGDEKFFPAFRNLLRRYAYKSLETEDFKHSFEQDIPNPPVPFETFFDQWIYNAGHPIFEFNFETRNKGTNRYEITVKLKQIQIDTTGNTSKISDVFVMPLTFISFGKDSVRHYDTLLNDSREQTLTYFLPFMPDSIKLDTRLILCEVASNILSVKESDAVDFPFDFSIRPNPVYLGSEAKATLRLSTFSDVKLDIYNEIGVHIGNIYQGTLNSGNFDFSFSTKNLSSGVYLLTCKAGDRMFSKSFSVVK